MWTTGRKKIHVKEATSAKALGPDVVEEYQEQGWPEQRWAGSQLGQVDGLSF